MMTLNYQKENRWDREVYCFKCKVYSNSTENVPKCPNCNSNLITVCHDTKGNKLTGVERKNDHYTK